MVTHSLLNYSNGGVELLSAAKGSVVDIQCVCLGAENVHFVDSDHFYAIRIIKNNNPV